MLNSIATRFEHWRSSLRGRLVEFASSSRRPVIPSTSTEWRERGNTFLDQNLLNDAQVCYRRGTQTDPEDAACFSSLGFVLGELGRHAESQEMLLKAVALNPGDFDSHFMLGNLASLRGELSAAIVRYQSALVILPSFSVCRRELCVALAKEGRIVEARQTLHGGQAFQPNSAEYHFFSGNLCLAENEVSKAVEDFQIAASLSPSDSSILINLGVAQFKLRNFFAAEITYKRIFELEPNNVQAHANIAAVFQMSGRIDLAIESYRRALQINPEYLNAHQNLLYALTYYSQCEPVEYLEEAKRYGVRVASRAKRYSDWLCPPFSGDQRPLRIGLVSGDLRCHPVGIFLEGILACVDQAKLVLVAYSNRTFEDELSERIKPLFMSWTSVAAMSDEQLAQKIHTDTIDILIDLAGHTENNRLSVFSWRAAPVQVAWLGYWASTGVSEVDYILVDEVSVPQSEQKSYSEKLWYLPDTRLCLTPPTISEATSLKEPPVLRNGYITFGSYQSLTKISQESLLVWSKVLEVIPTARLRLQNWELGYTQADEVVRQRLVAANIDPQRVDIHGGVSRDIYLGTYAEVDLILDTFPFPGGTTTAEALWMGVPTVTLMGNSLLARQGGGMLRCVGLSDFVAETEAEFIAFAIKHSTDLGRLKSLRAELRSTLLVSPLSDSQKFVVNLEHALIEMMENFRASKCARQ